jgi:hypothetical protein
MRVSGPRHALLAEDLDALLKDGCLPLLQIPILFLSPPASRFTDTFDHFSFHDMFEQDMVFAIYLCPDHLLNEKVRARFHERTKIITINQSINFIQLISVT